MANDIGIRISSEDRSGPGIESAERRVSRFGQAMRGLGKAAAVAGAGAGALLAKGFADNLDIGQGRAKLAGQLGLSSDDAKKAGKVAGEVYRDNWGENLDQVNEAIRSVGTNLGKVSDLSAADLKKITEGALAIASTFNVDVNDATRSAAKLISTGLAKDSTQAFDLITKGFQSGLDSSGDFLDTLNEYAPQFAKIGVDGPTALNAINQFLKAGARDTDAAADAFKEFGLRAIDGSKTTIDAYESLKLNAEDTTKAIAGGGPAAQKSMGDVIAALQGVKDPVEQNRIGVELFGTQWEDTVRAILPKLDLTKNSIGEIDGATDQMAKTVGDTGKARIESMQRAFEGWTQSMAGSSGPMGDVVAAMTAFGGTALTMAGSLGQVVAGFAAVNLSAVKNAVVVAATTTAQVAASAATKAWAAVQWILNAALNANPIGLIIIAIAALAAGIIYAYKHSETFRNIVQATGKAAKAAFNAIWGAIKRVIDFIKKHWPLILGILTGPIGAAIIYITRHWSQVTGIVRGVVRKVKGVVSGMWNGVVSGIRNAVNSAAGWLDWLWNKVTGIFNSIRDKVSSLTSWIPGFAHGGVIGAAGGGPRSGLVMVGEQGRELVRLPAGSTVIPHGATESMLGSGGGGGRIVLEISSGGSRVDDFLVELLRRAIRNKTGGNVQAALGR